MQYLLLLFVFVISLFIGSFLNVVIDRLVRGEQFIKGRSHCETCGHKLHAKDLIPLLSYIYLRGKCRYCGAKIPKILPIIELSVGITYTLLFYWYINLSDFSQNSALLNLNSILFLIFIYILFTALLLIFFSDLIYKLIPDIYTIILVANYFIFLILFLLFKLELYSYEAFFVPLLSHVISAVLMLVFFSFLYFITRKKALGEGDIFLSAALGIYLTIPLSIVMWFGAFILGSVIGVILLLLFKKSKKSKIAFGPFLILGFLIALLWGNQIIDWYLSLLLY